MFMYNVIKFQAPFDRIKFYNSGSISLYKAVILQAIIDVTLLNDSNISAANKILAEDARKWIFEDSEGFPVYNVKIGTLKNSIQGSVEEVFYTDVNGFVTIPSSSYTNFIEISSKFFDQQRIKLDRVVSEDGSIKTTTSNTILIGGFLSNQAFDTTPLSNVSSCNFHKTLQPTGNSKLSSCSLVTETRFISDNFGVAAAFIFEAANSS